MRIPQQHLCRALHCLFSGGSSFLLITLHAGPCLQQRSIHREVLVRQQVLFACLQKHRLEKGLSDVALQQPLPVLAEYGGDPDGFVHVQAHEPSEQQVILQLFHQQPFTANRVQHLQQQRPQQLLRRN